MSRTDKSEISKAEYYQLIGLLALAKRHNNELQDIIKSAVQITGEKDVCGHTADAMYCDYSADTLLENLDLEVSEQ